MSLRYYRHKKLFVFLIEISFLFDPGLSGDRSKVSDFWRNSEHAPQRRRSLKNETYFVPRPTLSLRETADTFNNTCIIFFFYFFAKVNENKLWWTIVRLLLGKTGYLMTVSNVLIWDNYRSINKFTVDIFYTGRNEGIES
jgi:hypothetical protein